MNKVLIRPILKLMLYEIYKGRNPIIYNLYVFACKCFVLNNEKDNIGKIYAKAVEWLFFYIPLLVKTLEFSIKRTMSIEE